MKRAVFGATGRIGSRIVQEPGTRTGSYRVGGEKLLDEGERHKHSRRRFTVAY